jgi:hypothetical protein
MRHDQIVNSQKQDQDEERHRGDVQPEKHHRSKHDDDDDDDDDDKDKKENPMLQGFAKHLSFLMSKFGKKILNKEGAIDWDQADRWAK